MYKDFEDWWEHSGIKETDSYCCIAQTYQFDEESVPQAFKSFARNCYTYGAVEGFHEGKKEGYDNMVKSMFALLDMLKIPEDIKTIREVIGTIEKNYK